MCSKNDQLLCHVFWALRNSIETWPLLTQAEDEWPEEWPRNCNRFVPGKLRNRTKWNYRPIYSSNFTGCAFKTESRTRPSIETEFESWFLDCHVFHYANQVSLCLALSLSSICEWWNWNDFFVPQVTTNTAGNAIEITFTSPIRQDVRFGMKLPFKLFGYFLS